MDFLATIFDWLLSFFRTSTAFERQFYVFKFLHADEFTPDARMGSSLQFFSTKTSDRDRQWLMDRAAASGENALCFFVFNYGHADGREGRVSIMNDPENIESGISAERVKNVAAWCRKMRRKGLFPVPIGVCCETEPMPRRWAAWVCANADSVAEAIVPTLNEFEPLWCSLLEVEKCFSPADKSAPLRLYRAIAARQTNPLGVGIHGTSAPSFADCADWLGFEQGGDPSAWNNVKPRDFWGQIQRYLRDARGKLVLVMEYSLGRYGSFCELQGLAGAFQETDRLIGVGCGAPRGLADFMRQIPRGMIAGRTDDVAILSWADGSQARHANLFTGNFWSV